MGHPLPQKRLVQELVEVPQNPAPWLLPDGCFRGDSVERREPQRLCLATPGQRWPWGWTCPAGPPWDCAIPSVLEMAIVME